MSNALERWHALSDGLNAWGLRLGHESGARETLFKQREEDYETLDAAKIDQRIAEQAHLFLRAQIVEIRQRAIDAIEDMGTSSLKLSYGKDYALRFNTFDEKRKEGVANFKMELQAVSKVKGKELVTGLVGERGGGLQENAAFSLRMAALEWLNYSGPLLIDEAWKSVSNDYKLHAQAQFLRYIIDATGRQVIFATHKGDVFGKYADNIILIEMVDGVATARNITYEQFLEWSAEMQTREEGDDVIGDDDGD